MKKVLLFAACLCSLTALAQDTTKLKQIDSIVNLIKNSNYKIQKDTVASDVGGVALVRYLTISSSDTELKKHVTEAHVTAEDGKQTHFTAIFYFDHNELIKIEEFTVEASPKKVVDWYFANGKPIHYTTKIDNAQERAETLLRISRDMVQKWASK